MRSLVVISAGLSTPSSTSNVSDTIARAVSAAVTARGESLEIHLVELSELIPDLSTALSTGIGTPRLEEVKQKLSSADALVAVTPVFKASYSGLFKTFFDVLDAEALVDMPVLIGATAGTARHSLVLDFALRPLFTYMRAIVVPTGIFVATEDFGGVESEAIHIRIQRAANELAEHMVNVSSQVDGLGDFVLSKETRRHSRIDPQENLTPFSELLRGHTGS
ncbi:FMN reductase [Corynebacterium ulcerans]|uniref:FMN reductase n=1 Tax=Corynebacterium silvaticum TaxID=2320431 RepID=UPI00148F303C|nr:FMN reductase [Corynebacterium silvaticum]NON69443.1 FMN reductase [Corynebacterium silvaticum]